MHFVYIWWSDPLGLNETQFMLFWWCTQNVNTTLESFTGHLSMWCVILFSFTSEEYVAIFPSFHDILTLKACESDLDYIKSTQTAGATLGPYLPWLVGVSPFWCGQYKLMAPHVCFWLQYSSRLTMMSLYSSSEHNMLFLSTQYLPFSKR